MLSKCLVDSDPAVRAAGRRTRVVSVGVSLLMQAALLTLLIIVPLIAAGNLPMMKFDAPTSIFRRGDPGTPPKTDAGPRPRGSKATPKRAPINPFQPPRRVPTTIVSTDEPPDFSPGCNNCVPGGPDIPGAISLDRPTGRTPDIPKPPITATRQPVRRSEGVQAALLIHRVQPVYPAIAKQLGRNGRVVMRAIIGADGRVYSLEVISGDAWFIESAKNAVLQWRYRPTLLSGEPTEVETLITVTYEIKRY